MAGVMVDVAGYGLIICGIVIMVAAIGLGRHFRLW